MHRTIVQNIIITIICSFLFFGPANIYRPNLGKVWLVRSNMKQLLLLLKKVGSARLRESDIHPNSSKTSSLQYQPIDRKKRKGKRVEDYSRDRAA